MLLSVAIIVKNEENVLERCITSVSKFADEIIIVDTGSTDCTEQIASAHSNVKFFHSKLYNSKTEIKDFSFSKAKNEAIKKCNGDWVIWWDADDYVDEDNALKIRNLAESTKEKCLYTFTIEYSGIKFEHCRMFKNGIGILFDESHSCHEYLNTNGFINYSWREIVIQHLPGKKHTPSSNRNILIMETDHYKRGMSDPRTLFYLANAYREVGRYVDSINFYDKYLKVSKWAEERFFARYYKAQVLNSLHKIGEARKELLLSLTEDFRFAEPYCLLGDLAFQESDFERAQSWYMMAANTSFPKDAKLFVSPYFYSDYPRNKINYCHEKLLELNKLNIQKIQNISTPISNSRFGKFCIPDEDFIECLSALIPIAKRKGNIGIVVGKNKWIENIVEAYDCLESCIQDSEVKTICKFESTETKTKYELYCRAAGFVTDDWQSIIEEAQKIEDEIRSQFNAS
jgi:glycosyltransferase involved in cell wall biosynthesis